MAAAANTVDASVVELLGLLAERCPKFAPTVFPTTFAPSKLADLCTGTGREADEQARSISRLWSSLHHHSDNNTLEAQFGLIFKTSIDYPRREIRIIAIEEAKSETDATLASLERTLEQIIIGNEESVMLLAERFMELNDIPLEATERYRFSEAYNLAYAIKVLVSNTPMKILLGTRGQTALPFSPGDVLDEDTLRQVMRGSRRPGVSAGSSSSGSRRVSGAGAATEAGRGRSSSGGGVRGGDSDEDSDEDGGGEETMEVDEVGRGQGSNSDKKRRKKKRSSGRGKGGGGD